MIFEILIGVMIWLLNLVSNLISTIFSPVISVGTTISTLFSYAYTFSWLIPAPTIFAVLITLIAVIGYEFAFFSFLAFASIIRSWLRSST